jgi:hypothetical protein
MVINLSSANQWVYNNDRGKTQFVLFKGFLDKGLEKKEGKLWLKEEQDSQGNARVSSI